MLKIFKPSISAFSIFPHNLQQGCWEAAHESIGTAPEINAFCRSDVLALSRDSEVMGAFQINRQIRSWDHLAAILTLLPTQSKMLPSGFFRSCKATGTHFGRGMKREKLGNVPNTSFPPSTGGWGKCGFRQCWGNHIYNYLLIYYIV